MSDMYHLSDLPEEILEHILTRLKFVDLMTMYDVNHQFRRLSCGLLEKQSTHLSAIDFSEFGSSNEVYATYTDDEIHSLQVVGFSNILRFLRLFSSYIKKLSIDLLGLKRSKQRLVLNYVVKKCHKSLTHLTVLNLSTGLDFKKIKFTQIIFVHFDSCLIRGTITHLSVVFPNAREIKLSGSCYMSKRETLNLMTKYPSLNFMKISPTLMAPNCYNLISALNAHACFGYHG